jgi:GAF domain-containing protein
MLHGFPSSSRMYEPLLHRLSDSFDLVAPDYPGFGHSGAPDPRSFPYTFENLAMIPLRYRGDTVGLIYLEADRGGSCGATSIEGFNAIAIQAAAVLANLRLTEDLARETRLRQAAMISVAIIDDGDLVDIPTREGASVPVIVITGNPDCCSRREGLAAWRMLRFEKAFDSSALCSVVAGNIRRDLGVRAGRLS